MNISKGEVYHDDIFDSEAKIISIDGDKITIEGPVGESDTREIDLWRFEHNINVGRYEKMGTTEVESSSSEDTDSIFDY